MQMTEQYYAFIYIYRHTYVCVCVCVCVFTYIHVSFWNIQIIELQNFLLFSKGSAFIQYSKNCFRPIKLYFGAENCRSYVRLIRVPT